MTYGQGQGYIHWTTGACRVYACAFLLERSVDFSMASSCCMLHAMYRLQLHSKLCVYCTSTECINLFNETSTDKLVQHRQYQVS